ncbi:hypothetical protein DASC09_050040 [Saccharomycopsis crataegensis]|uniref:Uncharacterized protein n=1 Tax=Saccharomycopsis crataegensis TaxID=43959 RepID=A0AAV5QT56_9ASCO|nr:hypothetical protein DASC09_050040 [Saccharomycopsis crataegensis]
MYVKAATYKKVTSSLFSTTFLVAFGVVGVSSLVECPANQVANEDRDDITKARNRMSTSELCKEHHQQKLRLQSSNQQ